MPGAAPAPHVMAASRDYDFDCYKPFFYDCAWDFNRSTAPSEDIWTKFEPLPTWPPSPMLLPPSGDPCYGGTAGSPDDGAEGRGVVSDRGGGGGGGRSGAGAVVLRDCMWSGFSSARATPDKLVTEKSGGLPGSAGGASLPSGCLPVVSRAAATSAAAGPAEMPPFWPGGRCLPGEGRGQGDEEEEDGEMTENGAMSPGSETPSDSDGEIDVVTVESVSVRTVYNTNTARQCNQQQQQRSAPAHASRGHIPPVLQEEHDYCAPSPPPCKAENPPAARRFRPAAAPAPPPPARGATRSRGGFSRAVSSRAVSSGCGSPRSSDSEYRVKRNAHNFLERQRRSDLRHGFLRLRDLIPELAHNDKAGMVQILRKAMEYSSTLQRQEKQLEEKKQRLKIRQQELLKRLEIVRNSQAKRS